MAKVAYDMVVIFDEAPEEFYGVPGRILNVGKQWVEVQIYERLGERKEEIESIFFQRDDERINGLFSGQNVGNGR